MKNILTFIAILLALVGKAQMQPADSLTGTYAGKYWLANPATNPWVITNDTEYVTNIDSVNCVWQAHDATSSIGGAPPADTYYTDYYSCNGAAPTNYYSKFYSVDSLRIIWDNTPQPPPYPAYSTRFYGKRINGYVPTAGINEIKKKDEVSVYPNPATDVLNVECLMVNKTTGITISDMLGNIVKQVPFNTQHLTFNIGDLADGIYFIEINTGINNYKTKFIKQ